MLSALGDIPSAEMRCAHFQSDWERIVPAVGDKWVATIPKSFPEGVGLQEAI